jgi:hypothetical protein
MTFKRLAALSFGALVVAGLGCAVTGCDSGPTGQQIEVSKAKTQDMLNNIGPQMKQKKQAEAAAKKAEAAGGRKAP